MTRGIGLSNVPLPLLDDLREAIQHDRIATPIRESDLRAAGFAGLSPTIVAALDGLDRYSVLATLELIAVDRANRPPPRLRLVWTGPESRSSVSRDTALVVRELFDSAQRTVVVGGYAFDLPEILAPLHEAMASRGVVAQLFLDIRGKAARASDADAFATAFVDRFFRDVWTFGLPKPEVFYDPRTAVPGTPWASLHAKCIVVDDERTLLTSANFTDRGQTRNIEAGVLIEDRPFSEELAAQWRQLVGSGLVCRYKG